MFWNIVSEIQGWDLLLLWVDPAEWETDKVPTYLNCIRKAWKKWRQKWDKQKEGKVPLEPLQICPYLLCPHQFLKRHTCVLQAWRQQVSSQGLQHRCQHSFEQFEKMLLCEFTDWFFWESCRKCRSVLCLQVWTMEWYGLNYWPWY